MSLASKVSVGLLLILGIACMSQSAFADDQLVRPAATVSQPYAVQTGVYQPFTSLEWVKFGATAAVNPDLAGNATIVYAFEPSSVMKGNVGRDIIPLLASRKIGFGVVHEGKGDLLTVDDKMTRAVISQLQVSPWELPVGKFLTADKNLMKVPASGEWISWPVTAENISTGR